MLRTWLENLMLVVCLLALPASAGELHNVPFPEKVPVELSFTATSIAPSAELRAEVTYKRGQARIEMSFTGMKPAILFGGDVTCYVVWAVTRDGQAENLGELLTRKASGRTNLSTGKKTFALMVTAESTYLAGRPSALVAFVNNAGPGSSPFAFDGLVAAPRHHMDGIAHIKWDSKVPLELLQARKALELAERNNAAEHAREIYAEAQEVLKVAYAHAEVAPKSRELQDSARRAVALANEALNISIHHLEAIELEEQLARRRAETAELERRAATAEAAAAESRRLAVEIRIASETARAEKELMVTQTAALRNEKYALESSMMQLRQEKGDLMNRSARLQDEKGALEIESARLLDEKRVLEAESQRLAEATTALEQEAATLRHEKRALQDEKVALEDAARRLQDEKDALGGRLQTALSHVADTEQSARGFVINLPDILFDLNQAELKPEAGLLLAKLSGILLIMDSLDAVVEGHTDSTGSATHNANLSQQRASAVSHFMQVQGINPQRLTATGFGMGRPVADNTSAEGRKRNRRVEIVISNRSQALAAN